jgi:hypothetical protein
MIAPFTVNPLLPYSLRQAFTRPMRLWYFAYVMSESTRNLTVADRIEQIRRAEHPEGNSHTMRFEDKGEKWYSFSQWADGSGNFGKIHRDDVQPHEL